MKTCLIPGCQRKPKGRLCGTHSYRLRVNGNPHAVRKIGRHEGNIAKVDGKRTREYAAWCAMKSRCYQLRDINYKNYGGRGIQVCERWRESFIAFIEDVGKAPSPKHSIDRINNDGNYEPGNVRWATRAEQARNNSRNRKLTIDGETLCLQDWSHRSGVNFTVIQSRLKAGLSPKQAVFEPARRGCQPWIRKPPTIQN